MIDDPLHPPLPAPEGEPRGFAAPLPPPSGSPDGSARRPSGWKSLLATAGVAAAVGAGVTLAVDAWTSEEAEPQGAAVPVTFPSDGSLDVSAVLGRMGPSVVALKTGVAGEDQLFGVGAGSGVIISDDGLVVTNAHVLEGPNGGAVDAIDVLLADGRTVEADLVGSAPADDLAVIRLRDADDITPAQLGEPGSVSVGDDVLAIGNALNLEGEPTVTRGIVSALDRTIPLPDGGALEGLVQTDAAINPGNSGGALVNSAGELIGINTAILRDAQNLGFAIDIGTVRSIVDDIRTGGGQVRAGAFLGVGSATVAELEPEVRDQLGIADDARGVVITSVQPGSGAADAGIQVGDLLTSIDGEPISAPEQLRVVLRDFEPGATITATVVRDGDELELEARLGSRAVEG